MEEKIKRKNDEINNFITQKRFRDITKTQIKKDDKK